jgi:hypothetical protein
VIAMNSSRRTKRVGQLSALLRHTGRAIAIALLLVGMSVAQHASQEPAQPTLHVQTDLVVIPFQVRRGSHSVSDLKSSDVVLLEDGVPRGFTGFEAPSQHPSLELAVMFDVTSDRGANFLSGRTLDEMIRYWNETIARALLEDPGANLRISVYQFDHWRLRRLCRSTSDPKELLAALGRLAEPMTAGSGFDLQLPQGVVVRKSPDGSPDDGPRSLLGAIAVLGDSAEGPAVAARALVIFLSGAEGTSITPQDLADQGVAANVPIYPVVLPAARWIWYDGYTYDFDGTLNPPTPQFLQLGRCAKPLRPDGGLRGWIDCPLKKPFASVGISTGGRSFEAPRRPYDEAQPGSDGGLTRFSMTGPQVNNILESVKRHALARFTSSYTLWFAPSPSGARRKHKLEVKLPPKSSGKLSDGKRIAIY